MSEQLPVTIDDIRNAHKRIGKDIKSYVRKGWPLPVPGFHVYYKCENLLYTGNFKERGALNSLLMMTPEERSKGIAAASAGNHAQACAYHGGRLGAPASVVMPTNSPLVKINNCKFLKANVILHGKDMAEAKAYALDLAKKEGRRYINGFNDPEVIAGAGTIGLEILDQLQDVDAVILPIGGGSMISGVSLAIKSIRPEVKIIGVESERCAGMYHSAKAGKLVSTAVDELGTIADGLAVPLVGDNSFKIASKYTDMFITVPERLIYRAMLHLLEKEKLLAEGAGATALAGLLSGQLDFLKGKKVCVVISGGNTDITTLNRVIERGLYSSGRLMTFECVIKDRVSGMAHFCKAIAETGASIKEIAHEHVMISDIGYITVQVTLETLSFDHCFEIREKMAQKGYTIKMLEDRFDDKGVHNLEKKCKL